MEKATVLFLCPHGAAKSVLAATYFQQLVQERELPFRADFAGTEPDETIMPSVVALLATEEMDVSLHRPRLVMPDELESAYHVVSLGCPTTDLPATPASFESWDDVPLVSQNAPLAAAHIRAYVEALVNRLADDSRR